MSEYTNEIVLGLVLARLNRMPCDNALDDYLMHRIEAARGELARNGITLRKDSADDAMLLVDTVVWQYSNRDSGQGMPDWLRLKRRERWLAQRTAETEGGANDP